MYKVSVADFALQENSVGHLNAIFASGKKVQIPSGVPGGFVEAWNQPMHCQRLHSSIIIQHRKVKFGCRELSDRHQFNMLS